MSAVCYKWVKCPRKFQQTIVIQCIEQKLILPPCDDWLRSIIDAAPLFIRRIIIKSMFVLMDESMVRQCFYRTLSHMVDGLDLTDPKSAGGWNRDEFNAFVAIAQSNSVVIPPSNNNEDT